MNIVTRPSAAVPGARIPPGPRGNVLTGNALPLQRDILTFATATYEQYGSASRVRVLPGYYGYMLSDPSHYKYVLQENSATYVKDLHHLDVLSLLVGRGMATLNGNLWKRRRQMAQPAFHRRRIAALAETMTAMTTEMLDDWDTRPPGCVVDIESEMTRVTLRIAGKTLMNVDLAGDLDPVGAAFTEVNRYISARWINPLSLFTSWLPTPGNRRYRASIALLNAAVFRIIAERRRSGEDPGDLLAMLLQARDETTGEGLNDTELRDEVMTILIAGHETASTALTWVWYLLSQNQGAEDRLHRELDTVLGGRAPTAEDLPRLPYTAMVFNEAMRLYPPAYAIGRKALLEDRLEGMVIPEGANIYLVPWVTHRRPDLWERPHSFEPERFSDEQSTGRPQYAFIPFGGGPRRCIGDNFAETESRMMLATVAQRYRLRLCPDQVVSPRPLVTIRPRFGMRMQLHPR